MLSFQVYFRRSIQDHFLKNNEKYGRWRFENEISIFDDFVRFYWDFIVSSLDFSEQLSIKISSLDQFSVVSKKM